MVSEYSITLTRREIPPSKKKVGGVSEEEKISSNLKKGKLIYDDHNSCLKKESEKKGKLSNYDKNDHIELSHAISDINRFLNSIHRELKLVSNEKNSLEKSILIFDTQMDEVIKEISIDETLELARMLRSARENMHYIFSAYV